LSSGLMRLLHRFLHFTIAWQPLRFYRNFLAEYMGLHNSIDDTLHLGEAAIDEQFRSCDVAAVVGCEKLICQFRDMTEILARCFPVEPRRRPNKVWR